MARTAPAPNIPAIPGMNPGTFVMGGGGGGGGSGAGGRKGGKGKHGAGGSSDGNDANGGGKGANSCGPGSGGGCVNPAHGGNGGTHAGDPVDPISGRVYTIPQTDMVLIGPLLFVLQRSYSSTATARDVGIGFGWTHSLAWEIEVRRRSMLVHQPSGTTSVRSVPPVGSEVSLDGGARLRRDADGFTVVDTRGLIYLIGPSGPRRWALTSVVGRAGNRIDLAYAGGVLSSLVDSAGREVRVSRRQDGRIGGFELLTPSGRAVWHRRYQCDGRGDLVETIDAEGRRCCYQYDDNHRLITNVLPSGLAVSYRYDGLGRCVETWATPARADDPALSS